MGTIKVKKAKLYEEDDRWYIDVTYLYEDDRYVKEIHIPKMDMPLQTFTGNIGRCWTNTRSCDATPMCEYYAELGSLSMFLYSSTFCSAYIEKIIEEKTQEMSIDEIEKKLGYKIKIVNKK